jgi:hypothetical protein
LGEDTYLVAMTTSQRKGTKYYLAGAAPH